MIPGLPLPVIPAPASTDLTDPTNVYPAVEAIVRSETVSPDVANRQPRQLAARTATLRDRVNALINVANSLMANLLAVDGSNRMTGDLNMFDGASRHKVVGAADGVDPQDAVNLQQLSAIRATLTSVQQTLSSMVALDGSRAMTGHLQMGGNRIIDMADPQNVGDAVTLRYLTAAVAAIRDAHLPRDGSLPMTGPLDMGNNRIENLPIGAGYPLNPGDAVPLAFLSGAIAGISSVPSGTLMPFLGPESAVPAGFVLPIGQTYRITDQPSLFAAIGFIHGGDPSSGTFKAPDMRGRTVAGLDNMGGVSAGVIPAATVIGGIFGEAAVTLTPSNAPAHRHTYSDGAMTIGAGGTSPGPDGNGTNTVLQTAQTRTTAIAGGDGAHNNVQPSIGLPWILKL